MNNIKKLNQLINEWSETDPENKNKMDEIQKQIIETRSKLADYPIELIKLSKSIKTIKYEVQFMDNYTKIEKYLKLFEKYHIKYNKEINLMNPNTEEIIKEIWRIKTDEYIQNPKYDATEIKKIIQELTN